MNMDFHQQSETTYIHPTFYLQFIFINKAREIGYLPQKTLKDNVKLLIMEWEIVFSYFGLIVG